MMRAAISARGPADGESSVMRAEKPSGVGSRASLRPASVGCPSLTAAAPPGRAPQRAKCPDDGEGHHWNAEQQLQSCPGHGADNQGSDAVGQGGLPPARQQRRESRRALRGRWAAARDFAGSRAVNRLARARLTQKFRVHFGDRGAGHVVGSTGGVSCAPAPSTQQPVGNPHRRTVRAVAGLTVVDMCASLVHGRARNRLLS